jgi:TonB family protein
VIFDLLIDTQGQVRQTQVVSSPDPELTQAASEALPKLKFKPAMRDGQPVAVRIRYRYNFEIER